MRKSLLIKLPDSDVLSVVPPMGLKCQTYNYTTLGGLVRRSASPCLPLCFEHHLGNTGIHLMGHKGFTAKHGFTQEALLEKVQKLLGHD